MARWRRKTGREAAKCGAEKLSKASSEGISQDETENVSSGTNWKHFSTATRDGDGARGAEAGAGVGLEMQHGQHLEHLSRHACFGAAGAVAKTLPCSTTRLAVRTTSHRVARSNIVFVQFIGNRGPRSYFFGAAFASAASIFFRYLAESFLKSSRQPLQHSFTSRPSNVKTYGSPMSPPNFSSDTTHVFKG